MIHVRANGNFSVVFDPLAATSARLDEFVLIEHLIEYSPDGDVAQSLRMTDWQEGAAIWSVSAEAPDTTLVQLSRFSPSSVTVSRGFGNESVRSLSLHPSQLARVGPTGQQRAVEPTPAERLLGTTEQGDLVTCTGTDQGQLKVYAAQARPGGRP